MAEDDVYTKLYHRVGKKRYFEGKRTYEYERIYVPIPSSLHEIIKPFLDQRLKITIANQKNGIVISLYPANSFLPAENTP
jgi:hypothetical protein